MRSASCSCGALRADIADTAPVVVACHCLDCQRRTGSPFGVVAYYPAGAVTIKGQSREFARPAASGGKFRSCFCPDCGSSVFFKTDKHPDSVGIAVGAFADPEFPAPIRSVWERSMHRWAAITSAAQHFERGRTS